LNAATNPTGDVFVECDRDKGEVYIRPVGESLRPINLFVSSATATYTLLLRRSDTPADTIVIRDKTPRALRATMPESAPSGLAPNHVRAMKALLVAMSSNLVPDDVQVEETSRAIQLWAEARFTLQQLYEGRGYVGEKYTLQKPCFRERERHAELQFVQFPLVLRAKLRIVLPDHERLAAPVQSIVVAKADRPGAKDRRVEPLLVGNFVDLLAAFQRLQVLVSKHLNPLSVDTVGPFDGTN